MQRTTKSTFGASTTTAAPQQTAQQASAPAKGPGRKEVGAIWTNQAKSGQEFLKVQLNLPKELVQQALAASTGDTVQFGLISFPNQSHEGNKARPTHRIFEDKK